jgi:integrase/recombinase XerD
MEAGVQVVKERDGGIVRRVVLLDHAGGEVELVTRFLSHLSDSGYSRNTVCAYGNVMPTHASRPALGSGGW